MNSEEDSYEKNPKLTINYNSDVTYENNHDNEDDNDNSIKYTHMSLNDIIHTPYNFEDYMEALTTAIGILFFVYLLLMSHNQPILLVAIVFGIILMFLIIVQNKYKNKYLKKLNDVKNKHDTIKKKYDNNMKKISNNHYIYNENKDKNNKNDIDIKESFVGAMIKPMDITNTCADFL